MNLIRIATGVKYDVNVFRYAYSRSFPPLDQTSNQAMNPRGSEYNGRTTLTFTLPCNNNDDPEDVPLVGDHYFLFAVGSRTPDNGLNYHFDRYSTDETITISCVPGVGKLPVVHH